MFHDHQKVVAMMSEVTLDPRGGRPIMGLRRVSQVCSTRLSVEYAEALTHVCQQQHKTRAEVLRIVVCEWLDGQVGREQ